MCLQKQLGRGTGAGSGQAAHVWVVMGGCHKGSVIINLIFGGVLFMCACVCMCVRACGGLNDHSPISSDICPRLVELFGPPCLEISM